MNDALSDPVLCAIFRSGAAFDAIVGLWVLLRLRGRPPHRRPVLDLARAALAPLAAVLSMALRSAVLSRYGLDTFGVIHIAFLFACLTLPVLAAVVVASVLVPRPAGTPLPVTRGLLVAAVAATLPLAAGAYAVAIEPRALCVEEGMVTLDPARAGDEAIRVAVLGDLQADRVGDYERSVIARVGELAPDLILVPGDIFQGSVAEFERELPALRELFAQLDAPGGVFVTLGDCDPGAAGVARVLEGSSARLLVDEVAAVEVRGRRLTIAGLGLGRGAPSELALLERIENDTDSADIRIVAAHHPDIVLALRARSRIDLVVSGHTHGGQIVVPFFGPPMTLSRVPREVAAGGLHDLDGRRIWVTRGAGLERGQAPRIRFLCPPEVSLLELR